MNYLALYRKYRPCELDDVVGQDDVKKILASSVKNNTITHAYLFYGPRGTGKTTMAKILAKMVNCDHPVDGNACNKCNSCLSILNSSDVIEIDAASNNGVDEIRDLREKANLVPSNANYKVYIIDEVHMLTMQAFNALLKTLEEPPRHVIFILATTEYYKIPVTITSRCQKFQFNKISDDMIVNRLKKISEIEKIDISDDALREIAKISDGGMRDSINYLDQLRSFNNHIDINDVYNVCGNVSIYEIVNLFSSIRESNYENVVNFFDNMNVSGKNYGKFLEDVISFFRDAILYKNNVSEKYIKSNSECLKSIIDLYDLNDIFDIIESVNKIYDRIKSVSRQSVIILSNFLLLMRDINNKNNKLYVNNVDVKNENINYDMAFHFTSNNKLDNNNLTDKVVLEDDLSNIKFENKIFEIQNENKDIIVNNAFALANKDLKKNLQIKMKLINNYLTDKKFMVAAGTILDISVEVASNNFIIFSTKTSANVAKVYENYNLCSELLNVILGEEYSFVIVTENEWSVLRDEYIKKIKNGYKYVVKPLIKQNNIEEIVDKEPTIIDKLFDLVGEDNIEFK